MIHQHLSVRQQPHLQCQLYIRCCPPISYRAPFPKNNSMYKIRWILLFLPEYKLDPFPWERFFFVGKNSQATKFKSRNACILLFDHLACLSATLGISNSVLNSIRTFLSSEIGLHLSYQPHCTVSTLREWPCPPSSSCSITPLRPSPLFLGPPYEWLYTR